MVRTLLSAGLCLGIFVLVTLISAAGTESLPPALYYYIIEHFVDDTGSKNAVASILLNYRMYDTMFEALILLTAIIGMKQFLPRQSDIEAARKDSGDEKA